MPIFDHTEHKPTLRLRKATRADTALIARMHSLSWAAAYRGILPDDFLDKEAPIERAAHWEKRMAELDAGEGIALIAELGAVPVGFVCLANPDASGSVLVDNLHALPGYRGTGAGSAMLDAAKAWARERGASRLHLSVLEDNRPAIGFYESRGWRFAVREDDRMGGVDLFSLVYTYELE
ncbi:GNAT family N-acetyltransferase [Caballeronia humi]|uniref:N-acetyltransferase GCN5 n=1 Tax=Caballeronia humi TaxID=326474 RepID=A0A158H2T7_9BURK|nr:GNAT family N-acetyltransferase [Caballeronia humi]SAL38341.1 N-acetyltransferase GCN5 [Caballeronia humi]